MKKRFLLYLSVGIIGVILAIISHYLRTEPQTPQQQALSRLMEMPFPDINGQPHQLSTWQGKPLIVNVWATWCKPCLKEMPDLLALQKELPTAQIIGIGIDSEANIRTFAQKLNIDYPLYVASVSTLDLFRELGNPTKGLPFTLVIDDKGVIRKTYVGAIDFDALRKDLQSFQML